MKAVTHLMHEGGTANVIYPDCATAIDRVYNRFLLAKMKSLG